MKKVFKLMLMSLLSVVISVSAFAKNKVVYVGTNAEFAPFEYLEKNKVVGFDIDLLDAISKETGLEFKVQDMAFDGLLPALQTKKVDMVIAGMSATPDKGVKVERFNASYAAIMALSQNKVDAVVLDSEPAKKYTANNKQFVIASIPAEEEDYAIAVRKNDKELLDKINSALDKIKANGEYDKLLKKYFK